MGMKPKLIIYLSAGLIALGPISIDTFLPSLPAIAQDLNRSPDQVAQLVAIYLISFAISFIFVGAMSDVYGRKPLLLGGLGVYIFASFCAVFSQNFEILLATRVVQAIGASAVNNTARALIRDVIPPKEMAKSFATIGSIIAIAPLIAPVLGGVLQEYFGWRASFAIMFVAAAIYFTIIILFLQETATKLEAHDLGFKNHLKAFRDILKHKHFQAYSALLVGQFMNFFAYLSISSFIFINEMGLNASQFGFIFPFTAGSFIVGNMVYRKYFHSPKLLGFGVLSLCLVTILLNIFAWFEWHNLLALALPMMLNSFGTGIVMGISFAGASAPFRARAGTATSLQSIMQYGFGSITASLAGLFHEYGMKCLGALFIIGSILIIYGFQKTKHLQDKVHA